MAQRGTQERLDVETPADGSQWRKIDRTYHEFDLDARNIRFGLSTDDMNPFGEMAVVMALGL